MVLWPSLGSATPSCGSRDGEGGQASLMSFVRREPDHALGVPGNVQDAPRCGIGRRVDGRGTIRGRHRRRRGVDGRMKHDYRYARAADAPRATVGTGIPGRPGAGIDALVRRDHRDEIAGLHGEQHEPERKEDPHRCAHITGSGDGKQKRPPSERHVQPDAERPRNGRV